MWLMFNDAFLSIVDKAKQKGCLMVRARRPGDIERVFPGAKVAESFGTDYRYRAEIPRPIVANAVAARVLGIDYDNFKGSTKDKPLHDAYMRVWSNMERLQPGGSYAREDGHRAPKPDRWLRDAARADPFFEADEEPVLNLCKRRRKAGR